MGCAGEEQGSGGGGKRSPFPVCGPRDEVEMAGAGAGRVVRRPGRFDDLLENSEPAAVRVAVEILAACQCDVVPLLVACLRPGRQAEGAERRQPAGMAGEFAAVGRGEFPVARVDPYGRQAG